MGYMPNIISDGQSTDAVFDNRYDQLRGNLSRGRTGARKLPANQWALQYFIVIC